LTFKVRWFEVVALLRPFGLCGMRVKDSGGRTKELFNCLVESLEDLLLHEVENIITLIERFDMDLACFSLGGQIKDVVINCMSRGYAWHCSSGSGVLVGSFRASCFSHSWFCTSEVALRSSLDEMKYKKLYH
jgi:hypothetical protein